MYRILIVVGSGSVMSHSLCNAHVISDVLTSIDTDTKTDIWNLAEKPLPFHDPVEYGNLHQSASPAICEFIQSAKKASAIVLCTPNYHGCMSGAMKNSIDNLDEIYVKGKPVSIVVNGGHTNSSVCDQLRCAIRSLNGIALNMQIMTSMQDYKQAEGGILLSSRNAKERINQACNELINVLKKNESRY